MTIIPETLRYYRRLYGSQAALAKDSGVSQKTISRIEGGDEPPGGFRASTIMKLEQALKLTPGALAQPPDPGGADMTKPGVLGRRKVTMYLSHDTALHYGLVARRYGMSARALFDIGPLCFALVAEQSLAKRRRRLAEIEAAIDAYLALLPNHLPHGYVAENDAIDAIEDERASLRANDLFASKMPGDGNNSPYEMGRGYNPAESNPFFEFLQGCVDELGISDTIDLDWVNESTLLPEFELCRSELDQVTGGNHWAKVALQWGYVRLGDIPEKLRGDDATTERAAWLEAHLPTEERERLSQPLSEFFDAEVGKPATPGNDGGA